MGMDVGRVGSSRRTRRVLGLLAAALVAIVAMPAAASAGLAGSPAGDCKPFGDEPCLLPFPNDLYTKKDKGSKTGLSVDLPQAAMPTNQAGAQIDVGPYDRNDGFSPGSMIVARVPGLDNPDALEQTNAVPLTECPGPSRSEPRSSWSTRRPRSASWSGWSWIPTPTAPRTRRC